MVDEEEDRAICSLYVGEHVESTAKHFAEWMTECLEKRVTTRQFEKMWAEFEEHGMPTSKVPGIDKEGYFWLDVFSFEGEFPDGFYRSAVNGKADRVITFNNNAYMDLVAIRGHPAPKDIAVCVLGKKNVGRWWTDEETRSYLGEEYLK